MSNFSESHLEDFRKSGISNAAIEKLCDECYLESHEDYWKLYYPELLEDKKSDYYTIRLDNPPKDENGKVQGKYKRPPGQPSRIYRPINLKPEILQDPTQDLLITEGEKKAIKAVEMGLNCLAIAGVYCFLDSKNEDDRLIPDMHKINWENRPVYLVFDNDICVKEQVQRALIKFASILISKFKAKVYITHLPDCQKVGKKLGLDDYLKEYGVGSFKKLNSTHITLDNARTLFNREDKITFPIEVFEGKTKEFLVNSSSVMDAPELIEHIEKLFKKLFELENKDFQVDEQAGLLFGRYFEELAQKSKNQNTPELLRSYLFKQKSYVARLALVLQCLDDPGSPTVGYNRVLKQPRKH
jgi:hypothetical protein